MYLSRLKKLAETRRGGLRKVAADIGMSEPNLHRCINNNEIKCSDLEKICNLFDVPISYFFDEEFTPIEPKKRKSCGEAILAAAEALAGSPSHEALEDENARLREELTSLQRQLIACNNRYIALLERELGYTSTEKGESATA